LARACCGRCAARIGPGADSLDRFLTRPRRRGFPWGVFSG
jgi:hypothetical protein